MEIKAKMTEAGTMAVTYRGETKEFPAVQIGDRFYARSVLNGKFRTGSKVWPLSVTLFDTGKVAIDGGFSNKGGIKSICGWFNPESAANTQHNGAR